MIFKYQFLKFHAFSKIWSKSAIKLMGVLVPYFLKHIECLQLELLFESHWNCRTKENSIDRWFEEIRQKMSENSVRISP